MELTKLGLIDYGVSEEAALTVVSKSPVDFAIDQKCKDGVILYD